MNVINGSGFRKTAIKPREVISRHTLRRQQQDQQRYNEAVRGDEYWDSRDGEELKGLLEEICD